jgi:preprotein translocase subunit Sss1
MLQKYLKTSEKTAIGLGQIGRVGNAVTVTQCGLAVVFAEG